MNRLVVIHYPFFGGPQNQALRLDGPLRDHGVMSTVALPTETGNASERLRAAGVDVVEIPLSRLRAVRDPRVQLRYLSTFARDVQRLRALIRDRRIDVVEVAGLINPQGAFAARLENRAVVWQILDTRAPDALRRVMTPIAISLADVIMTTGQSVAEAHGRVGTLGARLVPFFPPVDTGLFTPDASRRAAARVAMRLEPDAFVVGTVANFTPQKGLEYAFHAFERIRQSVPDAHFALFGRPMETHLSYGANLLAGARAIDARVIDPGERVYDWVPALDVFLMTAGPHSEGISTTVLEAMATGIPVVTTDVGGLREAVADGVSGFVVPPEDSWAIANAVLKLAADATLRSDMGRAARERAAKLFGVAETAAVHARAYDIAATRARSRQRSRRNP